MYKGNYIDTTSIWYTVDCVEVLSSGHFQIIAFNYSNFMYYDILSNTWGCLVNDQLRWWPCPIPVWYFNLGLNHSWHNDFKEFQNSNPDYAAKFNSEISNHELFLWISVLPKIIKYQFKNIKVSKVEMIDRSLRQMKGVIWSLSLLKCRWLQTTGTLQIPPIRPLMHKTDIKLMSYWHDDYN